VASKLRQLTLDCQGPHCPHAYEEDDDDELFDSDFPTSILSRSAAQSVFAATALSSLELVLDWTDDVAALCHGLPALRSLRWVGRWGGLAGLRGDEWWAMHGCLEAAAGVHLPDSAE
jgi:hypothetical protein